MSVNIYFKHVNIQFENIGWPKTRLDKISGMIFEILQEKIKIDGVQDIDLGEENIYIERINLPSIKVNPAKSDYHIAYTCASAIYLDLVKKLR